MLVLSDSDMLVGRDYLSRIMGEYMQGKKTGIVTSLYKTSRPASVGSALESLTIAVDFIPSVLVARRMEGIGFGLGASIPHIEGYTSRYRRLRGSRRLSGR